MKPSFLIISDSHGKSLPSTIVTSNYSINTYSISGLQWLNRYDKNLCVFSLLQTDLFSSAVSTTSNVLFLVGTNSVRNLPASEIISQIDHIFDFLYSHYTHLQNGQLVITTCLPCLKTSRRFPSLSSLTNNINHYNNLLPSLSLKYNLIYFDLRIPLDWLSFDKLHVAYHYRNNFSNLILNYIDSLSVNQNIYIQSQNRSRETIYR